MDDFVQPTREIILEALRDVIDPELGFNVVDLGLIYIVEIVDCVVDITMTMTTPGCPAQDYIMMGVQERGLRVPGVKDVNIALVWEPQWSPTKMMPAAKKHFHIPEDSHD